MEVAVALVVVILFLFIFISIKGDNDRKKMLAAMTPAQRADYDEKVEEARKKAEIARHIALFGHINEHLVCPHCQTQGAIRVMSVSRTVTYTGTVGGILKANTKTSTKKTVTQHHCDKCGTTWDV